MLQQKRPQMNETKSEAAQRLYPGLIFDTTLPQWWVDSYTEIDVRPHFVWGYPERSIFGYPVPITEEGERIAEAFGLPKLRPQGLTK
jgi:hypothetical protein